MNLTSIIINILAIGCLFLSFNKDKQKTKKAIKIAVKTFLKILPTILLIVALVGLLIGFVPHAVILKFMGNQSGIVGIFVSALLGAILYIPSIVAFPLAASFLKAGATVTAVATFITTLTMIGFVTLPLEIKELGKRIAVLRNGISFLLAVLIGIIIGAIL
ncbi:MAG: permease [Calditrichaeota bacterium]|nr:permease [Calditrichota bacterium]